MQRLIDMMTPTNDIRAAQTQFRQLIKMYPLLFYRANTEHESVQDWDIKPPRSFDDFKRIWESKVNWEDPWTAIRFSPPFSISEILWFMYRRGLDENPGLQAERKRIGNPPGYLTDSLIKSARKTGPSKAEIRAALRATGGDVHAAAALLI